MSNYTPLLKWDQTGEKLYETGVDQAVLFKQSSEGTYPEGVAWNGLSKVSEKPTGAEATPLYANNSKYLNLISTETLEASIEAYMYPDEFEECDGSKELTTGVTIGQQKRKTFGLCYRTKIGNDTDGDEHGYKLHFIYGATASPSEKGYATVNDSPEAITFTWELKTTPVNVTGGRPTALVIIDSTKVNSTKLAALEQIIYGKPAATEGGTATKARMPLPDEIATLMATE